MNMKNKGCLITLSVFAALFIILLFVIGRPYKNLPLRINARYSPEMKLLSVYSLSPIPLYIIRVDTTLLGDTLQIDTYQEFAYLVFRNSEQTWERFIRVPDGIEYVKFKDRSKVKVKRLDELQPINRSNAIRLYYIEY
ncbi:hypothetical protein [Bacteroides xylanisolvens]|uniref:hypothetical protein n=2 Tax=Bacteroides TaxID=816 RepID=UPI001C37D138|nr:hypothetical protein [Bacteroides xylanisolvens]MBV3840308.1 hypothetical protein [Bacteroides xylanisolvens]